MKQVFGLLAVVLIVAMVVAHQDYWNWTSYAPLLFGFLPVGLWYHAAYTVACSLVLLLLVLFLWPSHLENVEREVPDERADDAAAH